MNGDHANGNNPINFHFQLFIFLLMIYFEKFEVLWLFEFSGITEYAKEFEFSDGKFKNLTIFLNLWKSEHGHKS